jgi:hypothetical protein
MTVEDYLTPVLAIYGASLSTSLLLFEVYRFRTEQKEKQPRIDVTYRMGFIAQGRATSPTMIFLIAANAGARPVTLNIPTLLLPDSRKLHLISSGRDVTFPHELAPGKSCEVYEDVKKLAMSLKEEGFSGTIELVCEFKDALENSYKSRPFYFSIDDFIAFGKR